MKILRETSLILRNTALMTLAVVLGFAIGSAIGIPGWLQGFCLLPAGFLFYRLSGDTRPAWWKVLAFLTALSAITFVFTVAFPHIPQHYQGVAFIMLVMLAPVASVTKKLERLFIKTPRSDANSTSGSS